MTLSMHVAHRNTLSYRFSSAANAASADSSVSNAPNTAEPLPVINAAAAPQFRKSAIASAIVGRICSLTGCNTFPSAGDSAR